MIPLAVTRLTSCTELISPRLRFAQHPFGRCLCFDRASRGKRRLCVLPHSPSSLPSSHLCNPQLIPTPGVDQEGQDCLPNVLLYHQQPFSFSTFFTAFLLHFCPPFLYGSLSWTLLKSILDRDLYPCLGESGVTEQQ